MEGAGKKRRKAFVVLDPVEVQYGQAEAGEERGGMRKSARHCACGRRALSVASGIWAFRKDHPLCSQCFRKEVERYWRWHLKEDDAITTPDGKYRVTLAKVGRQLWMQVADADGFLAGRALTLEELSALRDVFNGDPGDMHIAHNEHDFLLVFGTSDHPVPIELPGTKTAKTLQ